MVNETLPTMEAPAERKPRRTPSKVRGIYEKHPGSGVWWVQFWDASGRRRRERAGTRSMAQALLAKRRAQKLRGEKLPETIRRRGVTVREMLELAERHAREHFASLREAAGGAADWRYPHLAAEFGSLDAATLTPQRIEQGLAKLAAERQWRPATFNRTRDYLSLAYKLGMRNGLVASNPARLLARRREDNGRIRFLSQPEEARLRAAIQAMFPEHEAELDLALATGMRQGNQYGLRWADIDLDRRQIAIRRAKNGRPLYLPINSAALNALLRLKDMAGDSPYAILNRNKAGRGVGQPPDSPESWFNRAVAKAGLHDVCWHTLRHTFASRAIMAGVDIRTLADLLGHRTLAMAMRYSHLAPQHQLEAAERIAAAFPVQSATTTATGQSGRTGTEGVGNGQRTVVQ
ncbi:MAG: tyrosine-type recombinase/integrase [Terriglobales bacterium]